MTFYPLATDSWDQNEHDALQDVISRGQFTMGEQVAAFEKTAAEHFGCNHSIMVNSGSSANLLAIAALFYHPDFDIVKGDNIIVPAVSWGTTYFPVSQYGLELRFVDVNADTLNLDVEQCKMAINDRTKAIFAVNLLGNPCELSELRSLCDAQGIALIEDNCESMGAKVDGKFAGTFGICGTLSTFYSHHISTMEGGLILTDDRKFRDICFSLRAHGWTRGLPANSHLIHDCDPFQDQFQFILPGYNLRPLEMSGALGLAQLKKLPELIAERRKNAKIYQDLFANHEKVAIQHECGQSSWFGFSFVLRGRAENRRQELVKIFNSEDIVSRPIVAGNFTENPVMAHLDHSFGSEIIIAKNIHSNGFFLGNHHFPIEVQLMKVKEILDTF